MPAPALPVPWPEPVPGAVAYTRTYRDVLGRPLTGTVTITGQARHDQGDTVIPPVAVTVKVVDGTLAVDLPPDTYRVVADLRTRDGVKVRDVEEIVVS